MLSHEGEERECSQDGGVKGTQEGRHPPLTICPGSLEGKFRGGRAHCLVPNLNWTEFNQRLPSLVGRCLDLLWLTQKKAKGSRLLKNERATGTTHHSQFHGEGSLHVKGIREKNRGPASNQACLGFRRACSSSTGPENSANCMF